MINSEALTKTLDIFSNDIKIGNNEYEQISGRRNTIVDLLEEYSTKRGLKIIEKFNVGSYKIRTGVKRQIKNSWAYDIDYVLVYDKKFDYENFKNNSTNWLRDKVKEKYSWNVIVSNKKKVISIAFRNENDTKTMFYLDIALYLKQAEKLYHIQRNESGNYFVVEGEPKKTYERQSEALANSQNKRNAILVLKYLKEKNRINGTSSIFITDWIIEQTNDLDTFSLIQKFIKENTNTKFFTLKELPKSNLITNSNKLNSSLLETNKKIFDSNDTTTKIHQAMNSWLDNQLPDLDKEIMENEKSERYSGG